MFGTKQKLMNSSRHLSKIGTGIYIPRERYETSWSMGGITSTANVPWKTTSYNSSNGVSTVSYTHLVRTQHPGDGARSFNDAETEKVIPKRINKLESPDDGNNKVKWLQKNAGEVSQTFI